MNDIKFRTSLSPKPALNQIGLKDKILTIGSCFSEVIGGYLSEHKFDVLANPFGTVYNPISIFNYLTDFEFVEEHYTSSEGLNFHYDVHSDFKAENTAALGVLLQTQKQEFEKYLKNTDYLIITLGTAHVYTLNSTDKVVANCHKVPQSNFTKRLLTLDEISASFGLSLEHLQKVNPSLKIILTLSPVRHTKDGIVENSTSKALLKLFCHQASLAHDSVFYFPSYEIMMDDLRDYRFYKEDMIHPSSLAEAYIWHFFQNVYFSEPTKSFIKKWDKVLSAMNHRPFNPSCEQHQKFIHSNIKNLEELSDKVDVSAEILHFKSQLI